MENYSALIRKFAAMALVILPTLAWSDIVVVVNVNNPIDSLQDDEVKRIFLGRVGSFPKTGKPMKVLDQTYESDTYKKFYEEIIGFKLRHLKRYRAAYIFSGKGAIPEVKGMNDEVKAHVTSNLSAIGYIDARYVDDSLKVVYPN